MEKATLSLIKKAAVIGGDVLLKHFNSAYDIQEKTKGDFVTSVDIEAETVIIRIIENIFPDHNILSEEKGRIDKKSDYTWIIDPLDGTNNYVRKIPIFGNTIALEKKGEVILGIMYFPMTKDLIYAQKGEGAYLNNTRLKKLPLSKKRVEELFLTFCHGPKSEHKKKITDLYQRIRPRVADMRKLGAASVEISHVARGIVDGYMAPGLPPWDFKAGSLIVREVGGTVRITKDNLFLLFSPGVEQMLFKAIKNS